MPPALAGWEACLTCTITFPSEARHFRITLQPARCVERRDQSINHIIHRLQLCIRGPESVSHNV